MKSPKNALGILVLAAGKGTRMRSKRAKVLHAAAGRPLLGWALGAARALAPAEIVVVVGHGAAEVRAAFEGAGVSFALQKEQRGTGHAARVGLKALRGSPRETLLLYGDVPLLRAESLRALLAHHRARRAAATVLTMFPKDPTGYGRVLRDDGAIRVVEHKDASAAERAVGEANTGIYVFETAVLAKFLPKLKPQNAQGELYLTDVLEMAGRAGLRAEAMPLADPLEALGVNTMADLATVEAIARGRVLAEMMEAGVRVIDPARTYVDADAAVGVGSVLHPGVQLLGRTRIGEEVIVEAGAIIVDSEIQDGARVKPYCVIEGSVVGPRAQVGPMAHLREGTRVGAEAKLGNFVETKKASLGRGAKASHLSYIGDAEVGADVNIGCGFITCNYDGVRKHKTVIEDGAFIGSDSQTVAPVRIGKGAYVGSGSTITKDVPADALAVTRAKQLHIEGWAARRRREIAREAAPAKPRGSKPKGA